VKLLREATDVLSRCGARGAIEQRIAELSARALHTVESAELAQARRVLLLGAVDVLTDRRS
jgi:hypothetical protein